MFAFNQSEFNFGPIVPTPWVYGAGLDDLGYVYAPRRCQKRNNTAPALCKLHIFAHGCGMQYKAAGKGGQFGLTYVHRAGFNEWAEANDTVVLYPQKHITCSNSDSGSDSDSAHGMGHGPYSPSRPCTSSMAGGCWDQAGGTGENFSDKQAGVQVRAVWAMVQRLVSGGQL
jgi:hypothetical protein